MSRLRITILFVLAVLFLAGCNWPSRIAEPTVSIADQVLTVAALTQAAQLTQEAGGFPSPQPTTALLTQPPTSTLASQPSNTPAPTKAPTKASQTACDLAGFVKDVTVPDGTVFAPNETFTKTWRLKNNGTCTWTSGYDLIFDSGDAMNGPAATQLTSGTVAPGGTVDISVNLKAPAADGSYRGNWKLRNASGAVFALNGNKPFFVDIKVKTGAATSESGTTTETLTVDQAGEVRGDGTVQLGQAKVGDRETDVGNQGFIAFDISGIPDNATILEVTVNFAAYDVNSGDPFGNLGCLRAYPGTFFPLVSGDYAAPGATGAILRWCDISELSTVAVDEDVKDNLQNALGNDTFELRLQFKDMESNGDGIKDMLRFNNPKLVVKYKTP